MSVSLYEERSSCEANNHILFGRFPPLEPPVFEGAS